MAPMIDMVFLLLVFFMCVSSITQAGTQVKLDLPESTESEVPKDLSHRLTLSVMENDSIHLGGRIYSESEIEMALLELKKNFSEVKLRIRADQSVPYSRIKIVMEKATAAGIQDYIYATYQASF